MVGSFDHSNRHEARTKASSLEARSKQGPAHRTQPITVEEVIDGMTGRSVDRGMLAMQAEGAHMDPQHCCETEQSRTQTIKNSSVKWMETGESPQLTSQQV